MPMAGGYTPTTNPNKKLYAQHPVDNAGSEWQDDIDGLADYYSTFFREYDPVIGRFNEVDPMAEVTDNLSTYHYSYNNPVNFNDPMGDYAEGKPLPDFAQQMQREYQAWRDARYGNNFPDRGWDFGSGGSDGGGGGGGILSSFDYLSTYAGVKIRLDQFRKPGLKYKYNSSGDYGYFEYFWSETKGSAAAGIRLIGVETESRWVPFPSFATLLANYPLPYSIRPDRTPINKNLPLDDVTGENFRYFNQCAIRMSICLHKSGVNLAGAKNISNPGGQTYASGNIIGALNLATHINGIFGIPTPYNGTKDDILSLLQGKTGIIFFQNFVEIDENNNNFLSWSNTHIDLWNGSNIQGNFSIPTDASRIWFWEIK